MSGTDPTKSRLYPNTDTYKFRLAIAGKVKLELNVNL